VVWVNVGGDGAVVCRMALSKFLVVKVNAASSNLIWLHQFLEVLRSDATLTVTP
jgi:hypothetical protein